MSLAQIQVGKRIRELRGERGLSQEALAHAAELDRTYINAVENGRRNISINNIGRICQALGISISKFFDSDYFNETC